MADLFREQSASPTSAPCSKTARPTPTSERHHRCGRADGVFDLFLLFLFIVSKVLTVLTLIGIFSLPVVWTVWPILNVLMFYLSREGERVTRGFGNSYLLVILNTF